MTVAEERQRRNLTQAHAATLANVTLRTWQRWETSDDPKAFRALGIAVPTTPRRARILQVLLTEEAARIIDDIPTGKRSRWVNSLIEESTP
jgi:transcriptional regulator with XRE-family HTH domain